MSPTTTPILDPRSELVWEIDPDHSRAEFQVRHLMIANVRGTMPILRGTIVQNALDVTRSRVEAELDATRIDTGARDRDAHLRSGDFFDVENHPTIRFVSTRVERADGGALKVHGELRMRGEAHAVVLDVELLGEAKDTDGFVKGAAVASTMIDRKTWGLNWNAALETGGVLVGDKVKVTLDLQAVKR